MNEPFANVAIIARSAYRYFIFEFAEELQNRHGSNVHLYCNSEIERNYYEDEDRDRPTFASINLLVSEVPEEIPKIVDREAVYSKARENEIRLDQNYSMFMVANRHLGRGYAPGGYHHPRSTLSESTSRPSSTNLQ